jgi:hypothetical protein
MNRRRLRTSDHRDFRSVRELWRDTKKTQEHRKDTKLRSLAVNGGQRWIGRYPWSERLQGADVGICIRASVSSIPATSKGAYVQA